MKTILPFLLIFLLLPASSYAWKKQKQLKGSGHVQTENRQAGNFDRIKVTQGIEVILIQGDYKDLQVSADDNILPYLITETEGKTLKIHMAENINVEKATERKVYVTAPEITEIKATTSASVKSESPWHFSEIELGITTAAFIGLEMEAVKTTVHTTTSGSLTLKGKTEKLEANLTTSGRLNATRLEARFAEIRATTAAEAEIDVTEELEYSLTTGAVLIYEGNPRVSNARTSTGAHAQHRK